MNSIPGLSRIRLAAEGGIARITLARADKANAFDALMWQELGQAMRWLDETPALRVGILDGDGRHFSAGLDHAMLDDLRPAPGIAPGHGIERLRQQILEVQASVTAIERCRKPVIAAIHGACIGGGLDIATACDIRLVAEGARMSVKEVDLGIIADVGVLQRLPLLVGEGRARELAFTAREFGAAEAGRIGLAEYVCTDVDALREAAMALARTLAAKSPMALRGTKQVMLRRSAVAIEAGLDHVATLNAGVMFSRDLDEALAATREGRPPVFVD